MAFDISTATPVNTGGFDISTAVPVTGGQSTDKSIIDRIGQDWTNRANAVTSATDLPNYLISSARLGVGGVSDIGTEAAKSIYNSIPGLSDAASYVGNKISNLPTAGNSTFGDVGNAAAGAIARTATANPTLANAVGYGSDVLGLAGMGLTKDAVAGTGKAIAGAALPTADEGLKDVAALAVKHNIPLSIDQISSSPVIKTAQKVSQELPFSGHAGFRDSQMSAFNNALLRTVGQTGTKITPLKMRQAFIRVGKEFDDLGAGQVFSLDDNFARGLDAIKNDAAATYSSDSIKNFDNAAAVVLKEAGPSGEITGEKLNTMRAKINALSRKSNNQDTTDLLHQIELHIIDTMTSNDPVKQAAFDATKQKYKNLLTIEPLSVKAKAGNINPTLLNDRVYKIYGRQHVIGNSGDIGDLARIGSQLLPQLGGSDTAQKAALALAAKAAAVAGTGGAAAMNLPATALGLAGNRALQSINRSQPLVKAIIKKGN